MADSERMEAVKRAYAEIILNTAAESAARILKSERKALGFQQSLALAKQEAVDMMVRMKSLLDSKIQEAETRNTLHARRIQELESQLQESESTILSLRNELERERNNNHTNNNNTNSNSNSKPSQVGSVPTEEEKEKNTSNYFTNSQSNDGSSCSARTGTSTGTGTGSAQDVTDTSTDREAKVRMRNGCTQRIIALDQSKDPKGIQTFGNKKGTIKKESAEKNDAKLSLRRGPPRKSRSKFNYVKISKFGMNIEKDEASTKKAQKGLVKCTENDESEGNNCAEMENGPGSDFDEALLGLELMADKIDRADKLVPATHEATQDLVTENPKSQENISSTSKPGSKIEETPVANLKPKIEENLVPITEQEGLRSIKYTFIRKRKRGSIENNNKNTESSAVVVLDENKEENKDGNREECQNGNSDDGNNKNKKNMKRYDKSNNNKNDNLKGVEKRSLRLKNKNERKLLDSPRSQRRMVQVARQLVSLSARKW